MRMDSILLEFDNLYNSESFYSSLRIQKRISFFDRVVECELQRWAGVERINSIVDS